MTGGLRCSIHVLKNGSDFIVTTQRHSSISSHKRTDD